MKRFTLIELLARPAVAPSSGDGRRQVRAAFTLIELLVVIAIIAILASMLLPALRGAKESANSASCLGNCRQLAMASLSYADSFNNYAPPAFSYNNWAVPSSWNQNLVLAGLIPPAAGAWPYGATGVFLCPSYRKSDHYNHYFPLYGMNVYLTGYFDYNTSKWERDPQKLTIIQSPSNCLMMAERASYEEMQPLGGDVWSELLLWQREPLASNTAMTLRHNNGGNTAWFDGHAAYTKNLRYAYLHTSNGGPLSSAQLRPIWFGRNPGDSDLCGY